MILTPKLYSIAVGMDKESTLKKKKYWVCGHLHVTLILYAPLLVARPGPAPEIFMDKTKGGTLVHEIKHKANINGISLSPTTHILWVCDNHGEVMEMVSGRLVQRFRTKNKPQCLCVTASDHIIVGMSDKASKFTTEGKMVNTVSFSEKTTSRFGIPEVHVLRITECPITSNVAMITNKGNVLVMDSDFNELFVRRCESIDGGRYNLPSCKAVCLMYDSVGNIIIGKDRNREITLLSGDGKFLRVLNYKEPFPPGRTKHPSARRTGNYYYQVAVGLDNEGTLWTVSDEMDIKLLQYNNKT